MAPVLRVLVLTALLLRGAKPMQPLFTQKEVDSPSSGDECESAKKDDDENPF